MMPKGKRKNLGVTLVELLISMVIGLVILSGVVKVVVDSKSAFLLEQEYAFIQENARFLMDELSYEIRMAGYFGCNSGGQLTNTLAVDPADEDDWAFIGAGIKGYEPDDVDLPDSFSSATAGTDVLTFSHGVVDDNVTVMSHVPSSATFQLSSSQPFTQGDILVAADTACDNMAIFQMSGPPSLNPSTIVHNIGSGVTPGNCRSALTTASGAGYTCNSGAPNPSVSGLAFNPGSSIMRFRSSGYYIADSAITGLPTLYRASLVTGSAASSVEVQELLSGVEDFQVMFGVDSSDPADGIIDQYFDSDNITVDTADAASSWVGWDRVLSARYTAILRSAAPAYSQNTSVDLGDGFTFNDRFLRQKVSSIVKIRNRGE